MSTPYIKTHQALAPLTSFKVGGVADRFWSVTSTTQFKTELPSVWPATWWLLGSGTNVLISDQGLPGLTIQFRAGQIKCHQTQNLIIADSGAAWDKIVQIAIAKNLWGIELLSGIPGTVGGAVAINISAYGQALADVLSWVEIYNPVSQALEIIPFDPQAWGYKKSPFAEGTTIVLRAALQLQAVSQTDLTYATALHYAQTHQLNPQDLRQRRQIILGTRQQAGSLLNHTKIGQAQTCGSFFKNPIVSQSQIKQLLAFEESTISRRDLLIMNQTHGQHQRRLSAALILLASGFKRGQTFGRVRLHPDHILKLENYQQASAQEIYDVGCFIQKTVRMKLEIDLEFEVVALGKFRNKHDEK